MPVAECLKPVSTAEKYVIIKNAMAQKPKLLMVDDEPDQLESFKNYFSRRNVLVFTAANGEEALSLIRETRPDLVLLDMKLSTSMDGGDVLRILREHDKETKVAIVTGDVLSEEEVKELTNLGIVELLNKPLSLQELEIFIKDVLIGAYPQEIRFEQVQKLQQEQEASLRRINHELANVTNDIASKCELYVLNSEEGMYKNKSDKERLDIAEEIIKAVAKTTEKLKVLVETLSKVARKET
jgi:DNA-binding response OmpR family regulator